MKYLYYAIFIIAILFIFMFVGEVFGEETLSGKLIVDFKGETAEYTESHDFSDEYETKPSAHVNRNPCNYCLEYFEPSACLEVCGVNN